MKNNAFIANTVLIAFSVLLLTTFTGCFNEPEPAYKSVPAEARIYLQEKGLHDLRGAFNGRALPAGGIAAVDYLNLDRNQLTNVAEVAQFTGLKWLRLNYNRLTSLPELKGLVNLRRIYLKNNGFEQVPEALKDLPALTDIELSGNPLKAIPDWLAQRSGLLHLSFNRTRLEKLPADLSAWKSLKSLQLGDLRLSAEEMARIRAALPKTAIVF